MRRIIFIIFVLLLSINTKSIAQTQRIDSLQKMLDRAKGDAATWKILFQLCQEQLSMYPDTALSYAMAAKRMANKSGSATDKKYAEYFIASALWRRKDVDSALIIINHELPLNPVTDVKTRDLFFRLIILKIRVLTTNGMMKEASDAISSLLAEADRYNDTSSQVIAYSSVGVLKRRSEKNQREALRWFKKAEALSESAPKFQQYSILYGNISRIYNTLGIPDSAFYYSDQAVRISREIQNLPFLQTCLSIKSDVLLANDRIDESEEALKESIALSKRFNKDTIYVEDIRRLADFYVTTKQYQKGIAICNQYLATDTLPEYRILYLEPLAQCYKESGKLDDYEKTLEELVKEKDKFYEQDLARSSADVQAKYEVAKKENTIMQQELNLSAKNYLLYGSALFILLGSIAGILLFINYRKREKLKLRLLLQHEKDSGKIAVVKAEEAERMRIAADLHDNLGSYASSIVSNLEFIQPTMADAHGQTALSELRHNSQAIVSELDDTIWALNKTELPLTAIGDRIKLFIKRMQPSFPRTDLHYAEEIGNDITLTASQAYHLFQVIREGINNALRHSQGRHIDIWMHADDHWFVSITDDGIGMPEKPASAEGGNGLQNMRTRVEDAGWTIVWMNNAERGTMVKIGSERG